MNTLHQLISAMEVFPLNNTLIIHSLFAGALLEKARAKVSGSYTFKKGFSRSKSSSSSDDNKEGIPNKRMKLMSEQRSMEIRNLTEIMNSTNDQIRIKRQRLERAKNVNDFRLCDQLGSAIQSLLIEKSSHERQLWVLNKKETKSKRYSAKKANESDKAKQRKSVIDLLNATKPNNLKQSSDSVEISMVEKVAQPTYADSDHSDSTADTVILESSSDDNLPVDDAPTHSELTNL